MPPVVVAAAGWLLGTLAVHELPTLPGLLGVVPLLLVALLAIRRRQLRPLLWFVAAAAWTAWSAHERLEGRLAASALGRDVAVTGWVEGFPVLAPGQAVFSLRVAPAVRGVPERLRLTWYGPPPTLRPGASFALTARLRPPHGARNPGGFDYEQWLLVNDVGATGYVRFGAAAPPSDDWGPRWQRYRARLAQRLETHAPSADGAALLVALAIGERYRFEDRHWDDFRRTGTSHLVAVSGTHVALLGLVVFALLRALILRLPPPCRAFDLEVAASGSSIATAFYAALTGFAVPAQRSLVMIAIALAVLASRRSIGVGQVLAATLLAVLAWDPFAPLLASFWLSFGAVAALLALGQSRAAQLPLGTLERGYAAGYEFVRLQWLIGFALVPLTAWYFGAWSIVGPLVNLVAIPVFNLVLVPLAVLATLVASIDGTEIVAAITIGTAGTAAAMAASGLHACAAVDWAALPLPGASWPAFAVATAGVAFAIAGPPLRGRPLGWLALAPLFALRLALPEFGEARAIVLDVGHGLAVLVETRHHRLLFDAGPRFPSGFDTGEDVVLPALAAGGRRDLDMLVVSHADNDHAGGAAAVAAAFPEAVVLAGPDVTGLPDDTCARGQAWQWDGVKFSLLHPDGETAARGNDSSCVLKVEAQGGTLLLTGDIEQRAEASLRDAPLAADVVVVPHHGSATSSSPAFVASLGARHAIVSAGWANRWGFPRAQVRERWQASGADVIVTGDVGAVHVQLSRDGVAVHSERDGRHHYWSHISMVNQVSARYSSPQF